MKKIMIANGKYTDKSGNEKTSWKEVGVIMTSAKGGEFCLLDPTVNLAGFPREAGKDRLIASIFEDKEYASPEKQSSYYANHPSNQSQQQPNSTYGKSPTVAGTDIPLEIDEASIPF